MASNPIFVGAPKTWMAAISTANTNRDGTGTVADVVTGGTSGSRIDKVRVQATGTTTAGVVRLFLYDGTNTQLVREVMVQAVTPSTSIEAWSAEVTLDGLALPSNSWKLRAATHNAESFRVFAQGGDF